VSFEVGGSVTSNEAGCCIKFGFPCCASHSRAEHFLRKVCALGNKIGPSGKLLVEMLMHLFRECAARERFFILERAARFLRAALSMANGWPLLRECKCRANQFYERAREAF